MRSWTYPRTTTISIHEGHEKSEITSWCNSVELLWPPRLIYTSSSIGNRHLEFRLQFPILWLARFIVSLLCPGLLSGFHNGFAQHSGLLSIFTYVSGSSVMTSYFAFPGSSVLFDQVLFTAVHNWDLKLPVLLFFEYLLCRECRKH